MKLIAVKLNEQIIEMIDSVARQKDISKSQLIRDALEYYLTSVLKVDQKPHGSDPQNLKIIC